MESQDLQEPQTDSIRPWEVELLVEYPALHPETAPSESRGDPAPQLAGADWAWAYYQAALATLGVTELLVVLKALEPLDPVFGQEARLLEASLEEASAA